MTTGATELFAGAVTAGATVLFAIEGTPWDCTWSVAAALVLPTFVLAISGDGALPANAYPEAIPNTAVAERPVTKILADVAGFFTLRLIVIVVFVGECVGGGGGGRSGSCIISHRLHLHGLRDLHDLRPLHDRHRRRGEDVVGRNPWRDCLRSSHSP